MELYSQKWRDTASLITLLRKMPTVYRDLLHQMLISGNLRKAAIEADRQLNTRVQYIKKG